MEISKTRDIKNIFSKDRYMTDIELAAESGNVIFFLSMLNPKMRYNKVEARESKIHGIGLFATEDIPKDKVITFYPAHSITKFGNTEESTIFFSDSQKFKEQHEYYYTLYTFGGLYNNKKEKMEYEITGDPTHIDNPLLLGHILNDSDGNIFKGIPWEELNENIELCESIFNKYDTNNKYNCDFETLREYPICFIVTKKNVKKGEELLLNYGLVYWYGLEYPFRTSIDSDIINLKKKIRMYRKN